MLNRFKQQEIQINISKNMEGLKMSDDIKTECKCYTCQAEIAKTEQNDTPFGNSRMMHMFFCPICGNKRCPHGTDHMLACTGSNDSGQKGSRYE